MSRFTLILRGLAYHWRVQLAAALAAAVGTAVLVGALIVGDSVRYSLKIMAVERLGQVVEAVLGGDKFFRADLARRLDHAQWLRYQSMILVTGICINEQTGARAAQVHVCGVNNEFWALGTHAPSAPPARGEAVLNQRLADALGVQAGASIRLRLPRPSLLSYDAPLGKEQKNAAILRAVVKEVLPDRGLGRFGFEASQTAPLNLFLPFKVLGEAIGQPGRANVLLGTWGRAGLANPVGDGLLRQAWSLDDAQLHLRADAKLGFVELSTPRVFLDDTVCAALLNPKADETNSANTPVLTYFVNALRANGKETPYSMVTAGATPLVPGDLKDDEIILNDWTAEDLQAKPGDKVELEYFTLGLLRKLETRKAEFTVKAVVPLEGLYADRHLMPDFPGIADVDSTHDWDSSIPIDMHKIRPKDEQYWKEHRGTPKAFIALSAGKGLWENRFGTYTALRFPLRGNPEAAQAAVEKHIREVVSPAAVGLKFTPVRAMALQAVAQATDFGGLFLGLSFFLIAAALLLMTLIFRFNAEARAGETGLLLALGFTPRSVRGLLWGEGAALAALGSVAGAGGGTLFARFLLHALTTSWRGAVGTTTLEYHAEPASLIVGYLAGVAAAMLAIYFAVRRQAALPARELLAAGAELPPRKGPARGWAFAGALSLAAALVLAAVVLAKGELSAPAFFGVGALLLLSGLSALRWLLADRSVLPLRAGAGGTPALPAERLPTLTALAIRAASRHSGRSLATAALLACGTFLVVAVGANQQDATRGADRRDSGTGGFALWARSTLPVYEDLNTPAGRAKAGVPDEDFAGVTIYPFRVKDGDEASCLNLNRAQQPRILGVPDSFIQRGGFTFCAFAPGVAVANEQPWLILKSREQYSAELRAVCDFQSLTWALGKKVGDTFPLTGEGSGETIERIPGGEVQIAGAVANSILQGSILISESAFLKLYPSESGYREFLVDAPPGRAAEVAKRLSAVLQDEGFEATPAVQRLAEFNAVENTYLATFQALGALGLLLGSLGLGIVVLRNMLERRAELALLRALGFSRLAIGWLVLGEHAWLLVLGLSAGAVAALAAVAPVLAAAGTPFPWLSVAAALAALAVCGLGSALLATWGMLRAPLLPALRNE
ncbi:MAG: ABC transporter permease [Planctomycetota bacterium]